jgi:hypothetical protein
MQLRFYRFLCFLIDADKNAGGVMLASPELSALVAKYSKHSSAKHAKRAHGSGHNVAAVAAAPQQQRFA